MRQLSGTDTQMLFSDRPYAQNLIAPFGIYDPSTAPSGRFTFDEVLAFVEARLHISESFRERLVSVPLGLDRPYWIRDSDFDLEYHVRHLALPVPGDWRQFCTQIARICERPLDLSRPPWEMYIIEGLDSIEGVPQGSFAMVLKLHHAAVDGVAGAEMITVLHDTEPKQRLPASITDAALSWNAEETPSTIELLVRAGVNAVTRPVAFAGNVIPAVRGVASMLRTARGGGGSMAATITATRFNQNVSAHRVFGMSSFPLEHLKRIKNSIPDAKINDVALALVGGALRRYLDAKGELAGEPLIALMPISVRPTQTQRPKAGEVEAAPGGNRFAMTQISMATDVADPRQRLQFIRAATAAAKTADAVAAKALTELSELLPGALMGSAQRAIVRNANRRGRAIGFHTIVTNVPGPQVPVYFCGARAVLMTGMAPIVDGMGLIHGVGSYNGDVPVCFTSDRAMMPDPEFYEECLNDSFAELLASCDGTPSPSARPKRSRPATPSAKPRSKSTAS